MAVFSGLMASWLSTQTAEINIQEENGSFTATVGNFGQITSKALQDEAGRPVTMQNTGFAHGLQLENLTAQLAPSRSQWQDPDMPRSFETRSGARAVCVWSAN
jgi:hypothetical protein